MILHYNFINFSCPIVLDCIVNFQIRGLANEVACLQSQLEQSETERQSLHLQLTLAERDSRQSTTLLREKETEWKSIQTAMKGSFVTASLTGYVKYN